MLDLGTLGGTCTAALDLNNRGQIVGLAFITGDAFQHAFLWDGSIHDLGTLGGNFASANAINDRGEAVGYGATPTANHAALWRHVGQITDLGTVGNDQCAYAFGINAAEQVVGYSVSDCSQEEGRAFLWEDGSMFDLNALIPPDSALYLRSVQTINDRGEIAGTGVDASGNQHAFLLIPCDEQHPGVEGCDYSQVDSATPTRESPARVMQQPTSTTPRTPALNSPTNRTLRPFGRRGLTFHPRQTEAKGGSFSIAENGGSPENPRTKESAWGRLPWQYRGFNTMAAMT